MNKVIESESIPIRNECMLHILYYYCEEANNNYYYGVEILEDSWGDYFCLEDIIFDTRESDAYHFYRTFTEFLKENKEEKFKFF